MAPIRTVIGFDMGGTKGAVGVFEEKTWKLLHHEQMLTQASRGFDVVFHDIVTLIQKFQTPDTVALGVGVPGLLRQPEGLLLRAPNIPESENFPLKERLQEEFKLPVFVENDSRCFTLAEAMHGAGKGHSIVIGITIGTGVGGGIVIDEKIFRGHHGFAGEFGHMLLQPGKPPYKTKDMRGEVEQFFSGTAMGNRCKEATSPMDYLHDGACTFMQPDIFREIAWTIANLTFAFDPSVIVLGGSTGKALKPHLKTIEKELKQWLLLGTPVPKIAIAECEHPGTLGAALLTRSATGF